MARKKSGTGKKAERAERKAREQMSLFVAMLAELDRRKIESAADELEMMDLAFARRTAQLSGFPPQFADAMLRSGAPFTDVVHRLKASARHVV